MMLPLIIHKRVIQFTYWKCINLHPLKCYGRGNRIRQPSIFTKQRIYLHPERHPQLVMYILTSLNFTHIPS